MLRSSLSSTHPRWFAASAADLQALLSDHLHCERKAAENALSLVRRYPHRGTSVDAAVAAGARRDQPRRAGGGAAGAARVDAARRHAEPATRAALLAEVRGREPGAAARRAAGRRLHRGALARAAGAARARASPTTAKASWPTSTRRSATPRSATPRSSWSWRGRSSRTACSRSAWRCSGSARPRSWARPYACRIHFESRTADGPATWRWYQTAPSHQRTVASRAT